MPRWSRRLIQEFGLFARGLWFRGRRHTCPVCGWSFRHFVHGGGSFRVRAAGYCPRCNSKGRHRLLWLYLADHPQLMARPTRLLHVSPHYSLGRRLSAAPGVEYIGLDLQPEPHVTVVGDVTALPFPEASFGAVVCVHVLEHVERDLDAVAELHRVTRPGGWLLVNVPVRDDAHTLEDASVRSPGARRQVFGEETHVRVYGRDVVERLAGPGFLVEPVVHRGFTAAEMARYGLPPGEASYLCRRPAGGVA